MKSRHAQHTIHAAHCHYGWDNAIAPVLTVAPGDMFTVECRDAADGHFSPASNAADIAGMVPGRVNPVTGPVFVDGAQPGDRLSVTFHDFAPSGFGWTAIIPGFGLLAGDFDEPHLHLWDYDRTGREPAMFGSLAKVPLRPFAGTVGVAPAEPGRHDVIPPRRVGGNMDIRDLTAGSTLHLPVEVEGALLSIGDTHGAQGDGEVCGTAIESAMHVSVSLELAKASAPRFPRLSLPAGRAPRPDPEGWEITTGIGPDLMQAAKDAVAEMIDLIAAWRGVSPEDAYMLCSVCGNLRISEIVDAPNWVVSFQFPRGVFV
jgi:acetamidase/formamidase